MMPLSLFCDSCPHTQLGRSPSSQLIPATSLHLQVTGPYHSPVGKPTETNVPPGVTGWEDRAHQLPKGGSAALTHYCRHTVLDKAFW